MANVAEREEIAMGIIDAAFDGSDLLVGEGHVVVVTGAILDDGAGGSGLYIFRQFGQHAHRVINEFTTH